MVVKIRGIYSTSLTKLFLDNGLKIATPSKRIQERLGIEGEPWADTIVYDKEDKLGVVVHGKDDEKIIEIFKENFNDFCKREIKVGDIYVGVIEDVITNKKLIQIDLGDIKGYLPISEFYGIIEKGKKIIVQVKKYLKNGDALLSTSLRMFGESAIVIKKGFSKVSKHLKNKEEQKRLLSISKEYQEKGYGILWKALAEGRPEEMLKKEINGMINELEELEKKYENMNIGKVKDGQKIIFVDFGKNAREFLDKIRDKILPTIIGHHRLRVVDHNVLVDICEHLIKENVVKKDYINNLLMQFIWEKEIGAKNGIYSIIHKKLDGTKIVMNGKIIKKDFENKEIVIRRNVRTKGIYDGLNIEKEPGDFILTYIKEGSWYIIHEYLSREGKLKGRYFSINTPIEIFPSYAAYIDLEIDVIEKNGEREIIDEDKLEEAVGVYIEESLAKKAYEVAESLLKNGIGG